MSNFICSECGMTNIDCGSAGYKTPREIELEKENKRLQEQLKEANIVITSYIRNNPLEKYDPAEAYCEKWGVE